jgi:hypothetical protein
MLASSAHAHSAPGYRFAHGVIIASSVGAPERWLTTGHRPGKWKVLHVAATR